MVDVHVRVTPARACAPWPGSPVAPCARRPGCAPTAAGNRETSGRPPSTPNRYSRPHSAPSRGPQRVALEVEEQVAVVGLRQHHQWLRVGYLIRRLTGDPRRDLQPRLRGERRDRPRRQLGHRGVMERKLGHRGDAGVDQLRPLADPHTGDEQQVVVRADLLVHSGQRKHVRISGSSHVTAGDRPR